MKSLFGIDVGWLTEEVVALILWRDGLLARTFSPPGSDG